MLKETRLTLRLSINNPLGRKARLWESVPDNMGYTGYSKSYSYGNSNDWGIQISYRFGSLRAQVKKTDKSISNDDVENRRN